jgi:carbon monoxide dehydrogenase subunit G
MALKLENEFTVAAPVADVWKTLLDLERVAGCLPGATIEPADQEGTFRGAMRVRLGPVRMNYEGTAKLEDVNDADRTAVFSVQGKESRGQGNASVRITNRLIEMDGSTRVLVETDLNITGRSAQFGRGIMQDVAAGMLKDFSVCLSELMSSGDGSAGQGEGVPVVNPSRAQPARKPEVLTLRRIFGRALSGRLARFVRRHG